jgi:hypothetical protein
MSRHQRIGATAGTTVVVVFVAGMAALALTSQAGAVPKTHHHSRPPVTDVHTVSSSTIPAPKAKKNLCPLTGQPAGGGKVPQRPALGVKIGNDPASRPQSGLLNADIVYEEMAEGGITRYLAVYQCHEAAALGPVRSVRWDDWHVLATYGHPILSFSGGINQWNAVVAHLGWLYDANGSFYPTTNAYYRTSDRQAPWNYYSTTAALWKLDPNGRPPSPQFRYSTKPPSTASRINSVTVVGLAAGSNVVWRWSTSAKQWERYYGSAPDTDISGTQLHTTNVVVEVVKTVPGPYAESGSVPDTNSITIGSGVAYVLSDGKVQTGRWSSPAYGAVPQLQTSAGRPMTLAPGTTWVEFVPQSYAVQLAR